MSRGVGIAGYVLVPTSALSSSLNTFSLERLPKDANFLSIASVASIRFIRACSKDEPRTDAGLPSHAVTHSHFRRTLASLRRDWLFRSALDALVGPLYASLKYGISSSFMNFSKSSYLTPL